MQFYPFGFEKGEETGSVELLGGKGAGLLWMASEGVPVPPGFVIPTSVWAEYDKKPKTTMKAIAKALPAYLAKLEKHFGYMPLLSVRSGARVSCPGMMDTILNVGIEGANCLSWTDRLGAKCFADSFHRLVTMYGSVVNGIRKESFNGDLKSALDTYQTETGTEFPDAKGQLLGAIEAVFKSWDTDRAIFYRKQHGYDRAWGTAVTVQAMVFGNMNNQSASGVLFTRNPATGECNVTGEFLYNAQGEDIVAGIRTPLSLDVMANDGNAPLYTELIDTALKLENLKKEMLDIEFTIQDSKLYLLQVRSGQRTATAAIKIALDMSKSGMIDNATAAKRVTARQFDLAQMATLDPKWTKEPAFTGIAGCPGIVTGKPVFSRQAAIDCKEPCILVTHETTPDDVAGMKAAVGIVTMEGGFTSHAAVVARGFDRACIVGVGQDVEAFKEFEVLSIDGMTGRIWTEAVPIIGGQTNGLIREFNELVCSTLGVVPVIFNEPAYQMSEALLYLGDKILSEDAVGIVLKTLDKVDRLYLDLVPSDQEQRYLNVVAGYEPTQRLLNTLDFVLANDGKSTRLTVIAKEGINSGSLNRITPVSDLRTLILSGQDILIEGFDTSDSAVQRVLDWKTAEGAQVVSIGTYLAGGRSMISVPQALQIVGV